MTARIKWKKVGLIFEPAGKAPWLHTHAWVPTPEYLGEGYIRIYFAGRNRENLSQIGAFTIHVDRPFEILDLTAQPLVSLGALGTFDDAALLPSCIVQVGDRKLLYYVAWMQGRRVPFHASLGLAISEDGGASFSKHSAAPVLDRNAVDPIFIASADIHREGDLWRCWYTSNTAWRQTPSGPLPRYHIRYAESRNGIDWERTGHVAIDFGSDAEYAISRPWVRRRREGYCMWYAYRGPAYRIGYAESADGIDWTRMDDRAGIDISADGFDSEMIEYAAVIDTPNGPVMFYNGNEFGYDGVAMAVAE
tara:strand:- start:20314 stop:21231 length:918 start_codon:yes stop_codon:yes gene_type:complete